MSDERLKLFAAAITSLGHEDGRQFTADEVSGLLLSAAEWFAIAGQQESCAEYAKPVYEWLSHELEELNRQLPSLVASDYRNN